MYARALGNTSFAAGMPEKGSVRNGTLLARNASVSLVRIPGIEVRVEMDDADGSIDGLQRAQDGQDDAVVATHGDDARVGPGIGRRRRVVEDLAVALLHLLERVLRIEWGDWDIAAIDLGIIGFSTTVAFFFLFDSWFCMT